MLIKVENCFPDQYGQDMERMLALSNILRSHAERNNIVLMDRGALERISLSSAYGYVDKKCAEDIRVGLREAGALIDYLDVHMVVDFGSSNISSSYDENKKSILVGYKFFVDANKSGAVTFIAENELDFLFFKKIAEFHSRFTSGLNLKVEFDFCLGAGSHCKPEFDRKVSDNKIVLCIVDNDKSHPKRKEGTTPGAFSANDRLLTKSSLVKVLECREIESLIPISMVEEIVVKKIPDKIEALDAIKSYIFKNFLFQNYFDFKNGMYLHNLIDLDVAHGPFWTEILSIEPKVRHKSCFTAKRSGICDSCSECPKIEGISEKLLQFSVDEFRIINLKSLTKKLDSNLMDQWLKVGRLVMSWGCSLSSGVVRS
jgi:hypothetical protein